MEEYGATKNAAREKDRQNYIFNKKNEIARRKLGFNPSDTDNSSAQFKEMERSYWEYLREWETEEWTNLRNSWSNGSRSVEEDDDDIIELDGDSDELVSRDTSAGSVGSTGSVGFVGSDDDFIDVLIREQAYKPLEDTRPYYYATYQAVRGTPQVYKDVPGTQGRKYILTSKGDEFQMNARTGTTSFMDVLNNKVVYKSALRFYKDDEIDGGRLMDD